MATVRAGVQTAVDVNGPGAQAAPGKWLDFSSAATWSLIWFIAAVVLLFFVL